eukprot:TRINITY_DN15406_c0_g1_i3.p1 TRINITY_DN15406_c0_g1~~TRINITY_DN15406_c0_g1_i3.p1  ORF type:complete len:900 (-),score=151.35 TRINITY_DN15406_c0_g1_i3:27-2726(-)
MASERHRPAQPSHSLSRNEPIMWTFSLPPLNASPKSPASPSPTVDVSPRSPGKRVRQPSRGKTIREVLRGSSVPLQMQPACGWRCNSSACVAERSRLREENIRLREESDGQRDVCQQTMQEQKQRAREYLQRKKQQSSTRNARGRVDDFVLTGERMAPPSTQCVAGLSEIELQSAISDTKQLEISLQRRMQRERQDRAMCEGELERRQHHLEADVESLESQLSNLRESLSTQEDENGRLKERISTLESELEDSRQQLDDARRELKTLRKDEIDATALYRTEAMQLKEREGKLRAEQTLRGVAAADPSMWGMSLAQLTLFHDEVIHELDAYCRRHEYVRIRSKDGDKHYHVCKEPDCNEDHEFSHSASGFANVMTRDDVRLRGKLVEDLKANMHLVVDREVKPRTKATNCSLALLLNPHGCKANIFVTHSWNECFNEFISTLQTALDATDVAWICSFALPQNDDLSVVLGQNVSDSPFALALRQASKLVVALETQLDVPNRAWCTYELALARDWGKRIDLWFYRLTDADVPALMARVQHLDLENAKASKEEDSRMIRDAIQSAHGGFDALNQAVRELLMDRLRWYKGVYDEHKGQIQQLESQLEMARNQHNDGEVDDILRRIEDERRKVGSACSERHTPATIDVSIEHWCAVDSLQPNAEPASYALEFAAGRCVLNVTPENGRTQRVEVACEPGETLLLRRPEASQDWMMLRRASESVGSWHGFGSHDACSRDIYLTALVEPPRAELPSSRRPRPRPRIPSKARADETAEVEGQGCQRSRGSSDSTAASCAGCSDCGPAGGSQPGGRVGTVADRLRFELDEARDALRIQKVMSASLQDQLEAKMCEVESMERELRREQRLRSSFVAGRRRSMPEAQSEAFATYKMSRRGVENECERDATN